MPPLCAERHLAVGVRRTRDRDKEQKGRGKGPNGESM
jgi:hypothetical protein